MKNTIIIYSILLLLSFAALGCARFDSSGDEVTPPATNIPAGPINPPVDPVPTSPFRLEPEKATTIGKGQPMDIFAVLDSPSSAFPTYADRSQVTWTSSAAAVASVSSAGVVIGITDGETVITATYQSYKSELKINVKGSFTKKTITIAGQGSRSYFVYTPSIVTTAAPLLLSFHGGGGNGEMQAAASRLVETADANNFIIAFPEGTGLFKTFNAGACCGSAQTGNVDDVLFVKKLIEKMHIDYSIDAAKIYSSGFSNGGILSHRLACEIADKISGIAAVGGASGQFDFDLNQYYACNPTRPIPILHFHTTNDRNYPINGGYGNGVSGTNYYSVQSTINDWIQRNNLTNDYTTESPSAHTTCDHYATTKNPSFASAPVSFCKLDPVDVYDAINEIVYGGGGHSWPGGVRSVSSKSDIPSNEFSASQYLWNFLTK